MQKIYGLDLLQWHLWLGNNPLLLQDRMERVPRLLTP